MGNNQCFNVHIQFSNKFIGIAVSACRAAIFRVKIRCFRFDCMETTKIGVSFFYRNGMKTKMLKKNLSMNAIENEGERDIAKEKKWCKKWLK